MDSNIKLTNLGGSLRPIKITRITEIIEISDLSSSLSISTSTLNSPQEQEINMCGSCKSSISVEKTFKQAENKVNVMTDKNPSKTFTIKISGKTTSTDTKEDPQSGCQTPQKTDHFNQAKSRKKVEFDDRVIEFEVENESFGNSGGLNRSNNSAFVIYHKEDENNALRSSSSSKVNSYFSKFYMDQLKKNLNNK